MDRLQDIKEALALDNGHLEEIEWRKDVEWLVEQAEKVERHQRVMNKILAMEEYTSTFDHPYYPVSIKEAKRLILQLDEPVKEEVIIDEPPSEEAYQKIIELCKENQHE